MSDHMPEHEPGPEGGPPPDQPGPQPPPEPPEASAEQAAPAEPLPEPPPEEPRRIWDPRQGRWVTEEELALEPKPPPPWRPAPGPPAPPRPGPPAPTAPPWVAAMVAGALGAVLAIVAMLFVPGVVERRPQVARPPTAGGELLPTPAATTTQLVRGARPWVVGVTAAGTVQGLLGPAPFQRSGSGIVLGTDGVIAAPARLFAGATTKVTVTLHSGRSLEAQLLGADLLTDVAALKVSEPGLEAAALGSAEEVELGDPVVAVAAPGGLQTVVVSGTVSAVGRTVEPEDGEPLLDLIQIDAPLGTAGSGGAVVGPAGTVIGMAPSFSQQAVGFAVPVDVVRSVAAQLAAGHKAQHPWLGLLADLAEADGERGLSVVRVFPDGPAARAGLEAGDVVVAIDGREVGGPLSLVARLARKSVGDRITLTVRQAPGERRDVRLTVAERPATR